MDLKAEKRVSPRDGGKRLPGPCARIVAAVFGSALLIAFLAVPVTTTTVSERAEPGSLLVVRTTTPRSTTMFLPQYLSAGVRSGENGAIRLRSAQWVGTMAIIVILGIFDYFVFCRLLRRRRPLTAEPDPGRE
jgi:hypothetical protein